MDDKAGSQESRNLVRELASPMMTTPVSERGS